MIFQDKIKKDEEKGGDNKFRGIHEGKVTEEDIEGVHGSTSSKDTVFDNQEVFPTTTDSRYFCDLGLPAIGFSPMANTHLLFHDHNELDPHWLDFCCWHIYTLWYISLSSQGKFWRFNLEHWEGDKINSRLSN
ncbi:uncharacterized protein LOC111241178 isoform X2 [Vigna radiata var. radiata]|uniref:Uncharacterized protein LOC111241178 isoform X2 n=1 Tax=Vigna radiata var. radiata TaxID=3916 RepID=A0A3Q0EQ32_VIGRR|nr:uncharacterized protein LOC111241178 isoform X2 [Vigna radiata var. radiata]